MTVILQSGYTPPLSDMPLTHARIGHAGNWYSGGTAAVSSTATDYFANAPLTSLTYEKWRPTSVPATWEYNHGSAVPVDYCAIAGHTLAGRTFVIQYWNGSTWVSVTPSTTPADNSPIFCIFTAVSAQRWRINITAGAVPDIAVVKFGRALQMPRPIFGGHAPIDFGRQTTFRQNESESGEFLSRTKVRVSLSTSFAWSNVEDTWVYQNWKTLQLALESEPFFIAWRPAKYGTVGYCMALGTPAASNMGVRNLMSLEMQVRGLAYD
jgi:hypothetical protein